jgi:hypothetical protein
MLGAGAEIQAHVRVKKHPDARFTSTGAHATLVLQSLSVSYNEEQA